jgi:hypothetical protein
LYLVEKDNLNKETSEFYRREFWRRMKFHQYSYSKKSMDNFLNKIKETFGENILIGTLQKSLSPIPKGGFGLS